MMLMQRMGDASRSGMSSLAARQRAGDRNLSYPTNFFIYCAMSRAFRTTFAELFCGPTRRGSLDRQMMTTDARMATARRCTATTHKPAESNHFPEMDVDVDCRASVALVDGLHDSASLEPIEEQNESCL